MARQKVDNGYGSESIQHLDGLIAIRKRPGMYIGGTDENALLHLCAEVLDNSTDEFLAGFGGTITVELGLDGSCTITDEGRGIPAVGKTKGRNVLEVLLTELHAGGK